MARLINAFEQFFDAAGDPLVSGKLFFFETGSNTVAKDTFADAGQTIPNSNPVILTGDGRSPNVFGDGTYRVVLTDSDDVQILSRDPVGGNVSIVFGADWVNTTVYNVNDVVRDDGRYWISQVSNNQNNRPSTDGGSNWLPYPQTATDNIEDGAVTEEKLDPALYVDLKSGRKNFFINGNFDIWQRGTADTITTTTYLADRWRCFPGTGGGAVISQQPFTLGQTDVPNEPQFFYRWNQNVAPASGAPSLNQSIEGVRTLAGQNATLSLYLKADAPISVTLRLVQIFGSGGSIANGTLTLVVNVTTQWQRFTATSLIESIAGKTIGTDDNLLLSIDLPATTTAILDVAQVQLEAGTTATDFEIRSLGEEEKLCKRYFERLDALNGTNGANMLYFAKVNSTTAFYGTFPHKEKRVPSTPTFSSLADFSVATATGSNIALASLTLVGGKRLSFFNGTSTVASLAAGNASTLNGVNDATIDLFADY